MKKLIIALFILFAQNIILAETDNWSQPASVYQVQKGDTWNSLAKKFDISVKLLKSYNNSISKKFLSSGNRINIPEKAIYTILPGETALKIAVANGMSYSELVTINNLSDPDALKTGDTLKIYKATPRKILSSKKKTPPTSPFGDQVKLLWPVTGKVINKFGLQPNGSHNNDIHILIEDSQIKAAASGTIVYTGNEVGSYGNLVIIQHENNWFSSYGNLSSIVVNKGDKVQVGQLIGNINLDRTQQKKSELYFGLRIGATAVNPLKYLKRNNSKRKA